MRWTSTGTMGALRSTCSDRRAANAGFTLIEALVAMTLLLSFVAVLGPYLFHARRIADGIDGRIAAQTLLRTLVDLPPDRSLLAQGPRDGEIGGMRWTVTAEPVFVEAMSSPAIDPGPGAASEPSDAMGKRTRWMAFHVTATVSWAPGRMVVADTVQLAPETDE
jgi:prepilin-type N-terminal cleavage/methylation domain-containing protein